jgi:hypothetical protein
MSQKQHKNKKELAAELHLASSGYVWEKINQ